MEVFSEDKFELFLDAVPDAMIITDSDGKIIHCNSRAEKMYQYQRGELCGQNIEILIPERYSGRHVTDRTKFMSNPYARPMGTGLELYGRRKDGTEFPLDVALNPLKTPNGLHIAVIIHDITEKKSTEPVKKEFIRDIEDIVRERAEMYESLVRALSDVDVGVAIMEGMKTIFVNEPMARIFGYTVDELLSMPWNTLIAPEDSARIMERYQQRQLHHDEAGHGETTAVHKSGARVIVEYAAKIISSGDLPRWILTAWDVTAQKRAAEALRQSRQRYQSLFDNSPISLWEEDFSEAKKYLDGLKLTGVTDLRAYFNEHPRVVEYCASLVKVVEVNQRTVSLYGASAKEQFYGSLKPILPESTNRTFMEELVTISEGKTSFQGEDVNLTFQGVPLNILIRWNVVPEGEGRYSRVLVSIIDITGLKKIESQLHLLGHAVESTSEMISITDLENHFIFVNKAFLDCYGYTTEEILGKSPLILRSPKNPENIPQQIFNMTRAGGWMGELLNVRKDGSEFPVYLGTSQVRNEDGKILGLIGVARDITDRHQAEEALLRAKAEIENLFNPNPAPDSGTKLKVEQTRAEMLQLRRDLARDIVEVAANVRSSIQRTLSFASLASHELRTPLTVLRNELEGVLDIDASPKQLRETVISTYDEILRLNKIVEQMLALARMQAGTYKVEFRPVDIRDVFQKIYDDAVVLTRQKNLSVVLTKSPKIMIRADETQLRHVFFNLLDNAMKFTPTGGRIRMGYEKIDKTIVIEFSNTGRGIPKSRLNSIFEPFHGGKPEKSPSSGTGLGLALSKMIINAHRGTITVESKASKWTTFKIQLPIDPDSLA